MKHSRLTSLVAYITLIRSCCCISQDFFTLLTLQIIWCFIFFFLFYIVYLFPSVNVLLFTSLHLVSDTVLPTSARPSCKFNGCRLPIFFFVFVSNHQTPWNDINLDTHIESAKKIGTIKQNKHKVRQHKYPSKTNKFTPREKKEKKVAASAWHWLSLLFTTPAVIAARFPPLNPVNYPRACQLCVYFPECWLMALTSPPPQKKPSCLLCLSVVPQSFTRSLFHLSDGAAFSRSANFIFWFCVWFRTERKTTSTLLYIV